MGNNTYYYWLKENGQGVKNRYLMEELFAFNGQFEKKKWSQFLCILKKLCLRK